MNSDKQDPNTIDCTAARAVVKRVRKHSTALLEVMFVVVVLLAFSTYQQRNLLAADRRASPTLSASNLEGELLDLDQALGQPVLVYFFAPWCNYCAASADNIVRLRRYRDAEQLTILMVALEWNDRQELQEYADKHSLNVPVLMGDAAIARDWMVYGFPTYYVLDSEHRVVSRDMGYSTQLGLWWRTWF